MTEVTITLPEPFDVALRNGASVTVDPAQFSPEIIAQQWLYGVKQVLPDAASGALANAFDAAFDHELTGDELKAARKAFGADNPDAVRDEAQRLMEERLAQQIAGEWAVRSASGAASDPVDAYRLSAALDWIRDNPESDDAHAYAAIPSDDQPARKEFRLELAARIDGMEAIAQRRYRRALEDAAEMAALKAKA